MVVHSQVDMPIYHIVIGLSRISLWRDHLVIGCSSCSCSTPSRVTKTLLAQQLWHRHHLVVVDLHPPASTSPITHMASGQVQPTSLCELKPAIACQYLSMAISYINRSDSLCS